MATIAFSLLCLAVGTMFAKALSPALRPVPVRRRH
jgi:hypothetical protein